MSKIPFFSFTCFFSFFSCQTTKWAWNADLIKAYNCYLNQADGGPCIESSIKLLFLWWQESSEPRRLQYLPLCDWHVLTVEISDQRRWEGTKDWGDTFAPSGHKVGPGPQLRAHQLIKGSCVNRRLSWFLSEHPKANFKDSALLKLLQLATLPASCASHFASHLHPAPPFMSGYYDGSEKNQFCLCCHWCLLVFFLWDLFLMMLSPPCPFHVCPFLLCVLCQPLAFP